jgi:hypothetical protein
VDGVVSFGAGSHGGAVTAGRSARLSDVAEHERADHGTKAGRGD